MPPKTKFSKEDIIQAAFLIAQEKGLSAITIRGVADHLGSSVAPIYVNFESVNELIEAVIHKIFAITQELLLNEPGENMYERIGRASLEFARRYPVFFRELVMKPNPYITSYEAIEEGMLESLERDKSMVGWTLDERKRLLLKMKIVQMGLSVMIANDNLPSWFNEDDCEVMLMEIGNELLEIHNIKRGEMK